MSSLYPNHGYVRHLTCTREEKDAYPLGSITRVPTPDMVISGHKMELLASSRRHTALSVNMASIGE